MKINEIDFIYRCMLLQYGLLKSVDYAMIQAAKKLEYPQSTNYDKECDKSINKFRDYLSNQKYKLKTTITTYINRELNIILGLGDINLIKNILKNNNLNRIIDEITSYDLYPYNYDSIYQILYTKIFKALEDNNIEEFNHNFYIFELLLRYKVNPDYMLYVLVQKYLKILDTNIQINNIYIHQLASLFMQYNAYPLFSLFKKGETTMDLVDKTKDKSLQAIIQHKPIDIRPSLREYTHVQPSTIKDISSFITAFIDNYDNDDILDLFAPSDIWLNKQNNYLKSLSLQYKNLIKFYTHNGDELLNYFLRYKPSQEIIYRFNEILKDKTNKARIKKYLTDYPVTEQSTLSELAPLILWLISEINIIIENSPPTTSDMVVYRGLRERKIIRKDNLYETTGFLSTTLSAEKALDFGIYVDNIIVPRGTKCLYISNQFTQYDDEEEILFPPRNCLEVLKIIDEDIILLYRHEGVCESEIG